MKKAIALFMFLLLAGCGSDVADSAAREDGWSFDNSEECTKDDACETEDGRAGVCTSTGCAACDDLTRYVPPVCEDDGETNETSDSDTDNNTDDGMDAGTNDEDDAGSELDDAGNTDDSDAGSSDDASSDAGSLDAGNDSGADNESDAGMSQDTGSDSGSMTMAQKLAACKAHAGSNVIVDISAHDLDQYTTGSNYHYSNHAPAPDQQFTLQGSAIRFSNPTKQSGTPLLVHYDEAAVYPITRMFEPGEQFTVALLVKSSNLMDILLGYETASPHNIDPNPSGAFEEHTVQTDWSCVTATFTHQGYGWSNDYGPQPSYEQFVLYYGQLDSSETLEVVGGVITAESGVVEGNVCEGESNGTACQYSKYDQFGSCRQGTCVKCMDGLWVDGACDGCTSDSFCDSDEYCEMNPSPPNPIDSSVGKCYPTPTVVPTE